MASPTPAGPKAGPTPTGQPRPAPAPVAAEAKPTAPVPPAAPATPAAGTDDAFRPVPTSAPPAAPVSAEEMADDPGAGEGAGDDRPWALSEQSALVEPAARSLPEGSSPAPAEPSAVSVSPGRLEELVARIPAGVRQVLEDRLRGRFREVLRLD